MKYSNSVDKLLSYGEFDYRADWSEYLELGFSADDIPALLQLALDEKLLYEEEDNILNSAPLHAWRVLGQLKAEEAILPLLAEIDNDDDWSNEEAPKILGLIGEKAILPLKNYLFNPEINENQKWGLVNAFEEIVKNYPECKAQSVAILIELLNQITEKDSTFAGFIVCSLTYLSAKEQIEIIREAFQRGYVDISIVGDIEDVEIKMGLRAKRATQRPMYNKFRTPELVNALDNFIKLTSDSEPVPKVGRNNPCPCGSGKKYKKCCLH